MGKSNFDDEEIELKCRTDLINEELIKEDGLKLFVNNSVNNSMNKSTINSIQDNDQDDNMRNGLLNDDRRQEEDQLIDNLSTDNLHIKQQFKEIDLNDKSTTDDNDDTFNETSNESLNNNNNEDHTLTFNNTSSPIYSSNDKLDANLNKDEILTNSIKLFRNEFRRLGFNEKYWRYTSFNKNFTLCSTYPPFLIIPAQFIDNDLSEVAKFRHMGRLPSVVYRHRNGAVIVRSSQPSVGLLSRRSTEDEMLLQLIFANCIQDQAGLQTSSTYEANCDCCCSSTTTTTVKLNGSQLTTTTTTTNFNVNNSLNNSNNSEHTQQEQQQNCQDNNQEYCSCKCHSQDVVIKSKNCQPIQSSKFFSLSDKILENIMSYTSYNDSVPNNQPTTTTNSTNNNKKLLILDARSFTVAFLNRVAGGGSECSEYYPNCEVDYLYLANIHAVRTAFFAIKPLIRSNDNQYNAPNSTYFSNWSKSSNNYWLYYISNLIESALKVVQAIDRDARPVLIHCSDGWDRTAQIASLAELMLDPFYRTIQGFKVLVQREWLDFGHKFADRNGLQPVSKNINERSPIFIQWLDCVYQIVRQCPDYFEFNCTYLEELAFHTYSPLFGTFSCNSYLERFINQIHGETTSVWNYLEKSRDKFINENYVESIKVLEPSYSISDMTLWRDLYQKLITDEFESRFDMKNTAQLNSNLILKNPLIDSINNQRKKKLFRAYSFTTSSHLSSINSNKNIGLRRTKSDSSLTSTLKKTAINNSTFRDGQLTPPFKNFFLNNTTLEQLRNGNLSNFQYSDQRLDPQHSNGLNNYEHSKSNCSLNGGKTCKLESKTNCDSTELQYHVPLKPTIEVIAHVAKIANSNPDSSLMMSVLTYMNTLHTFSVK